MAKGQAARRAKLTFPESSYYPDILQTNYSEKQLRDEYTRLRDIAQKRIKRLGKSEYAGSATYQKWKEGVPKLRDLKNTSDIAHGLSELASFIGSKYSSVSGQKELKRSQAEVLEKHYPGLDLSGNKFDKFTKLMNAQVQNNIEKIFGSNRAVMLFKVLENKGIKNMNPFISTPARMAYWLDNLENLEAVELPKGKHKSAKAYKELVESEIFHGRDRREVKIPDIENVISGRQDPRKQRAGKREKSGNGRRSQRSRKKRT